MTVSCFGRESSSKCTKESCLAFFSRDRSLRFGILIIVLAVVFWGKNNLSAEARDDVAGVIIDRGFEWTARINELMVESRPWMNFFEISSSGCIDLIFLTLFSSWIYNGESFRLIVAYALFYGVRAGLQAVLVLPYPSGIVWIFPVAPSLVVPFGVTSDFFPSGHVGFCVIGAAEFFKRKWYVAMVLCWLAGIYETIIMLSARNHYTIDLYTGALMAHYFHDWAHVVCTGWGKICIDRIVGPYLLYKWNLNPLNPECYKLPTNAAPDMSSPRSVIEPIPDASIEMSSKREGGLGEVTPPTNNNNSTKSIQMV